MSDPIRALLQSSDPIQRKRGISAAAKSGDARYLNLLAQVYKTETNPDLRELAKKAGAYLHKQTQNARPAPTRDDLHDNTLASIRGEALRNIERESRQQPTPPPVSPRPANNVQDLDVLLRNDRQTPTDPSSAETQAHIYYNRAFELHLKGDDARATLELGTAFRINPKLAQDPTAVAFAAEMTGQPREQAAAYIGNPDNWRSLTERYGGVSKGGDGSGPFNSLGLWIGGGILLLIVVAIALAFLNSEVFAAALRQAFSDLTGAG